MIEIDKLKPEDVGRRVIYGRHSEYTTTEQGIISSWNDQFVFVKYARPQGDMSPEPRWNPTSAATRPEDLEFAEEGQ